MAHLRAALDSRGLLSGSGLQDRAGGPVLRCWVTAGGLFAASADVAVDIFRLGWPWLGGGDPGPGYRRVDDAVLQP